MPPPGYYLPNTMSSSFLGGAGSAAGYGIGTAAASLAGSALSSKGVNFRGKYERNVAKHKLEYDPQFIKANTIAGILGKAEGARKAGLHPLAALGISPSAGTGSTGPSPIIPGQSELGGAVEKGINTAMAVKRANQQQAYALEEQSLRNDWLRQQMRHSELKFQAQLANYRRPPQIPDGTRPPRNTRPHPTEAERVTFVTQDGKKYSVRGGTSAQDLEEEINDWAQWMPETLGRALDTFKGQMENYYGDSARRFNSRQEKRRASTRKFFSPAPGSQRPNPRYRR